MTFAALPMVVRRTLVPARTRSFSDSPLSVLRERLSGQMGSESAKLELKWMREELRTRRAVAASSTPLKKRNDMEWEIGELGKMVDRRLQGEPLQYILGEYGTRFPPRRVLRVSTNCPGNWLSLEQQSDLYMALLVWTFCSRHRFLTASTYTYSTNPIHDLNLLR